MKSKEQQVPGWNSYCLRKSFLPQVYGRSFGSTVLSDLRAGAILRGLCCDLSLPAPVFGLERFHRGHLVALWHAGRFQRLSDGISLEAREFLALRALRALRLAQV